MPKTLKKEKQYTYYHNMLKYVSLILRIKKMIYLHTKPERKDYLYNVNVTREYE